MFEYLMPALWMRHYPDTIMEQSMRAVVRCSSEYGAAQGRAVGHFRIAPVRGAQRWSTAMRHSEFRSWR